MKFNSKVILQIIFVTSYLALILYSTFTIIDLEKANDKLKTQNHELQKQLDKCNTEKFSIEVEKENKQMALDEVYELFLVCQRGYGSEEE